MVETRVPSIPENTHATDPKFYVVQNSAADEVSFVEISASIINNVLGSTLPINDYIIRSNGTTITHIPINGTPNQTSKFVVK